MEKATNIEQQITLLSRKLEVAKARFGRWLVVCCVLAVAASVIAVGTKSAAFFAVAGFAWFFVWNRWKARAYVSALSAIPVPSDDVERVRWVTAVNEAALHPPSWWDRSENFAGATFIALFALVTYFVVVISGLWMRVLYAVAWAGLVLYIVLRVKDARRSRKSMPAAK
jgi:Flp pilus assembly protein TadB